MTTNKSTTLKTLLMLSIVITVLLTSPIMSPQLANASTDLLFTINNPTPKAEDRFGAAIASTSQNDVIVGAFFDDINATNAGSVYLFDEDDGSLLLTINNPTPESNDRFGFSVASADENMIIGAHFDNTNATSAGSVYLYEDDGTLLLTINNPTPEAEDQFGVSVASTTHDDIIVGAWNNKVNSTSAGSVHLYNGTDGTLLLTINNPTPVSGDQFGVSVASTTNDDIIIGAWMDDTGATDAGSVYLYDGEDGTLLLTINNPTPESSDRFGFSVASTDEDNIIVGAYRDNTNATDAGSVYLFDGEDGTLLLTINNPTPQTGDRFGRAVANMDDNIIVGAFHDNTNATDAGSAYLYNGTDGSLLLTLNNPTPQTGDRFGRTVASTNNDILVGAHFDNTNATSTGSVYLFEG